MNRVWWTVGGLLLGAALRRGRGRPVGGRRGADPHAGLHAGAPASPEGLRGAQWTRQFALEFMAAVRRQARGVSGEVAQAVEETLRGLDDALLLGEHAAHLGVTPAALLSAPDAPGRTAQHVRVAFRLHLGCAPEAFARPDEVVCDLTLARLVALAHALQGDAPVGAHEIRMIGQATASDALRRACGA